MSKLYIPTTTLNFNNLLSSESISPAGFYSKRGFGYQTFAKVELNKFDNSILLYDKFPKFSIPKSDYDDYPMIIEIEKEEFLEDLQPIKIIKNASVFQCDKTIYLNPFTTRIYFVDSYHKKIAISKSESSAETKLVSLYLNGMIDFCEQIESFDYKADIHNLNDIKSISYIEIEKDKSINRIKGFAYSFLIGANKSLRKDIVCLKKQAILISNIVSSILNTPNFNVTAIQENQLTQAINIFNKLQCNDIINDLNTISETTKGEKILEYIINKFRISLPISFDANKIKHSLTDIDKCNSLIKQLFNYIEHLENSFISQQNHYVWSDKIAVTASKLTSIMDDTVEIKSRDIYQSLINEVLTIDYFNGKSFSPKRLELATEITKKVKSNIEEDGQKWENHIAKEYLNNLRKNVGGDDVAFQVKWDNGVLPAISAFILKGDDTEKLENFLIENEIPDYRLSFGFYGALFGFASLSKVFTNNFYENSNKNYINETYKSIFKQLYNVDIQADVDYSVNFQSINQSKETTDQKVINNQEINILNLKDAEEIYFNLEKKCTSVKKYKSVYIEYLQKYGLTENLILALREDSKLKTPKSAITFLNSNLITQKKVEIQKIKNPEIFPSFEIQSPFYLDIEVFDFLKPLVPVENHKYLKQQIDWIQTVHRDGRYSNKEGKVTLCDNKTNEQVIKFFCNLLKKKLKDNKNMLSIEIIETIYSKLNSRYSIAN